MISAWELDAEVTLSEIDNVVGTERSLQISIGMGPKKDFEKSIHNFSFGHTLYLSWV